MSQSSWLVAGMLPGIGRQPRKKLEPSPERLLALLHRWRDESVRAGRTITRITVAFEAGRDGFWLARWLEARGVEAHVIHPSSVAVSREHRRAKTDRLDTELLKRGFLGWLRGERGHCSMARVPTNCRRGRQAAQSGARVPGQGPHAACEPHEGHPGAARHSSLQTNPAQRGGASGSPIHAGGLSLPPNVAAELERHIARLGLVIGQIKQIEEARRQRLEEQPERGPHAMVRLLARVVGIGIETADMLKTPIQVCKPSVLQRRRLPLLTSATMRPASCLRSRVSHCTGRAGDFCVKPRLHRTRNLKFESISLQRRVGCELGYCKGGPAASFRGRHKRVRDSNAAPHSDDVRTGSSDEGFSSYVGEVGCCRVAPLDNYGQRIDIRVRQVNR